MKLSEVSFFIVMSIMIFMILCGLFIVPLSKSSLGVKTRLGGRAVELPCPTDFAKIINMGKNGDVKYIVYETTSGTIKMKEFSDFSILEVEYVITSHAVK